MGMRARNGRKKRGRDEGKVRNRVQMCRKYGRRNKKIGRNED